MVYLRDGNACKNRTLRNKQFLISQNRDEHFYVFVTNKIVVSEVRVSGCLLPDI